MINNCVYCSDDYGGGDDDADDDDEGDGGEIECGCTDSFGRGRLH